MRKKDQAPLWIAIPVSVIAWVATILLTILANLSALLILWPLSFIRGDETRERVHWAAIAWAKAIIWAIPIWDMEIEGAEKVCPQKNYLIVANHQSLLDILIVCAGLPICFKFLAKKSLFGIPFMGWYMQIAKYIPVDRESRKSRYQALLDIGHFLEKGNNILVFPEGTRSVDGEIHSFHPAAFKFAHKQKVHILPVVIDGTGEALPKNSKLLNRKAKFHFSVLDPVSLEDVQEDEIESVIEKTREKMVEKLKDLRASTNHES